jgi:hypothetical protein
MVDITPNQLEYAALRAFARKTNLEPLNISKEELNNELNGVVAIKKYNNDGSVTLTFEEV